MFCTLAKHSSTVESDIRIVVAAQQEEQDLRLQVEILDGWKAWPNLAAQHVVEYVSNIFAALEIDFREVLDQKQQKMRAVYFLTDLRQLREIDTISLLQLSSRRRPQAPAAV